jgi:hypothetical protein
MAEWDVGSLVRIQQALNAAYGPHEEDELEAEESRNPWVGSDPADEAGRAR